MTYYDYHGCSYHLLRLLLPPTTYHGCSYHLPRLLLPPTTAALTTYYGCSYHLLLPPALTTYRYHQGFDGLDAFLGHTWAVTVTGAPKPWAIKFVEEHEETPRCWYGAAFTRTRTPTRTRTRTRTRARTLNPSPNPDPEPNPQPPGPTPSPE